VKVVIFCGGLGLRLRDAGPTVPKPMVPVGTQPILWHIMKYYAHFGHKEFILCLGHRAEAIKEYFLAYDEAMTNDFVLTGGGKEIELLASDIHDWRITFLNTGLNSNIGERLKATEPLIGDDEIFLVTYGDGLTDAPLPDMVRRFEERDRTVCFLAARPTSYSFHTVTFKDGDLVDGFEDVTRADLWVNAGFFVMRRGIFDVLQPGEDLLGPPLERLIERDEVFAYRYDGFWAPMDTLKDKSNLDALVETGRPPWALWELGDERPVVTSPAP
jgi:glucose-1-phosphate cytidylyltransferase